MFVQVYERTKSMADKAHMLSLGPRTGLCLRACLARPGERANGRVLKIDVSAVGKRCYRARLWEKAPHRWDALGISVLVPLFCLRHRVH